MKRLVIILCLLVIFGCKTKQTRNDDAAQASAQISETEATAGATDTLDEASAEDTTQDVTAEAEPDTIWVSHQWHDCGYLFGRPDESKVNQWKNLCCENICYGSREEGEYGTPERMLAILDFYKFLGDEGHSEEEDDFTLWRLSEYMPTYESLPDEYTRFRRLDVQIDSILNYEPFTQCSLNDRAYFEYFFVKTRANTMYKRLSARIDSLASLLDKENRAYWRYHDIQTECYDTVFIGHDWFSSEPMSIHGMATDDVRMRQKSLEAFYFFVTDRNRTADRIEKHITITMKMINDEYDHFISELPTKEYFPENPVLYPLPVRQRKLNDDRQAFCQWMNERRKISAVLTGTAKFSFDRATNNARRCKLFMLKNRYEGYGIGSETYFADLLQRDCTDKQLLEYHIPEDL